MDINLSTNFDEGDLVLVLIDPDEYLFIPAKINKVIDIEPHYNSMGGITYDIYYNITLYKTHDIKNVREQELFDLADIDQLLREFK